MRNNYRLLIVLTVTQTITENIILKKNLDYLSVSVL